MKRFLTAVFRIKIQACILFAVSVCIGLFVSLAVPAWEITEAFLWQDLFICLAGSFFQWLAYGSGALARLRYGARHLLFASVFLVFLSACAYWFHWFPVEYFTAWLLFVVIFLAMFFATGLVFELYFRITGKKYDDALASFKQRQDGE